MGPSKIHLISNLYLQSIPKLICISTIYKYHGMVEKLNAYANYLEHYSKINRIYGKQRLSSISE